MFMPRDIIMGHIKDVYRQTFDYEGRASRVTFWTFVIYYMVVAALCGLLMGLEMYLNLFQIFYGIFAFVHIFVLFSLSVRRLHDTGRSGWWMLIGIIPLVGSLVMLIFFCGKGDSGDNRFGLDPLRYEHAPGQEVL